MSISETIHPDHLGRLAVVYVRQSSPHQALANQESLKLQYDLQHRARAAGWDPSHIRVIDSDLGRTGRTAEGRRGFQELVALVNQEQVGIIFAYDVTRLARNCTDWYQLLDLCGYRSLPRRRPGRHLRPRHAQRPADPRPQGLDLRTGAAYPARPPDRRTPQQGPARRTGPVAADRAGPRRPGAGAQASRPGSPGPARSGLHHLPPVKAACRVVQFFNDRDLLLPRRDRFGDLVWRRPTVSAILSILKNPAYAGAFVYGRTRAVPRADAPHQRVQKPLPMDQWKVCLRDKYPAYIGWDTFERIQAMVRDNYSEYDRNKTRGVPRPGKALLHGIVYCGECGHKMVVQYKKGARYICNYLRQQYRVPVCQNLPADPIDAHVVRAFLDALSPAELDLYGKAVAALRQDEEQVQQAQRQQIERLRYQARLAERQYNQADPDNRLVAAELERRWEAALRELKEAEERFRREQQQPQAPEGLSPEEREAFLQAGETIPELWRQGRLTPQQKKAFLRSLIDKVVVHRTAPDTLQVRIVWRGGDTTAAALPVTVGSLARLSSAEEMEKEILELAHAGPDRRGDRGHR